jgi:hypothetical protein
MMVLPIAPKSQTKRLYARSASRAVTFESQLDRICFFDAGLRHAWEENLQYFQSLTLNSQMPRLVLAAVQFSPMVQIGHIRDG